MVSPPPRPIALSRAKRRRMPIMSSDLDEDGNASGKAMQLEALQETLQAEEEWLQVSDCHFHAVKMSCMPLLLQIILCRVAGSEKGVQPTTFKMWPNNWASIYYNTSTCGLQSTFTFAGP